LETNMQFTVKYAGAVSPEQKYRARPNELKTLFWNSRFKDETFMFWVSGYIKYAELLICSDWRSLVY